MTAASGGGRPDKEGRAPTSSVLERPEAASSSTPPALRSLASIFPPSPDPKRNALMQDTWSAFCTEMVAQVKAIDRSRSPAEVAYAAGEIVHNFFRVRGATLTSQELRQLVGELLEHEGVSKPEVLKALSREVPAIEKAPMEKAKKIEPERIVSFEKETPASPWQSEEAPPPRPVVPEKVFEPPASTLVEVRKREEASFDRLLAAVVDNARPRIAARAERGAAKADIASSLHEILTGEGRPVSADLHARLERAALSELCGLGLIDRLWADPTVHAVFVNGPAAVYIERNGVVERTPDAFRDQAHLSGLIERLASRPASGVAQFVLRDGTSGTVVFPPAAPQGPVLAMRRAEPGAATFDRLIASAVLSRAMADLLRLATRCRLNVLVAGAAGSGKTALLAAAARDIDDAGLATRVVTVARHRAFRSTTPARIELVGQVSETTMPVLLTAAAGLRPDVVIADSLQAGDMPALVERFAQGGRGTIVATDAISLAAGMSHMVDLIVRLARGPDGRQRVTAMQDSAAETVFAFENGEFRRHTTLPTFASTVRAAGFGEALAAILR